MAVTGPRVGSSAKAETGLASMKAAGAKLGLSVPFKMSQMIGKSVAGLIFAVDVNPDYPGNKYGNFSTHGTPKGYLKKGDTGDKLMQIEGIYAINFTTQQVMFIMSDPARIHNYTAMIIEYSGTQYKLVPQRDALGTAYFNMVTNVDKFTELMMKNLGVEFQMKVIQIT
ncbi:hypothetical protein [Proteus phage PM2]|uniref:Phage tail fibre adhesin Gp38 N-terminal domain-containing protein n=1 Tax=Proteus phage PM2 TaxID=2025809 RepID=A0A249XYE8_9CAUD|nr:tail fiber adhesin [Proteus phage PM2]ASZ76506.1 hypothetical protein [Proteus phage PM2]